MRRPAPRSIDGLAVRRRLKAERVWIWDYCAAALLTELDKLADALKRINVSPLGSGAGGGTGFDIDREQTAALLGFDGVIDNSLAGVSMRDFAVETLSACAILGVDLSRAAEDLIAWASTEFGVVDLGEEYAGTSSIMPQKKNPIALETVRSKAAFLQGQLVIGLTTLKGTNLGHNWDCYEIDPALKDATRSAAEMVRILKGVYQTCSFNPDRMLANLAQGFSTVTELADTLVRTAGLSFRSAHTLVGRLVSDILDPDVDAKEISAAQITRLANELVGQNIELSEEEVRLVLDVRSNVERRASRGGPAERALDQELLGKRARQLERAQRQAERLSKYQASADRLHDEARRLRGTSA